MNSSVQFDERLFDDGPPCGLQKRLRLIRSRDDRRVAQRVVTTLLLGWVPLALFTGVREFNLGISVMHSFVADIGAHARFLVAVPLLLLAESDAAPRMGRIARHFLSSGIVIDRDLPAYSSAVSSTKSLLNSRLAEWITFGVAYLLSIMVIHSVRDDLPAWHVDPTAPFGLSAAGLWHAGVSLPLLLTLLLGWLWRILLWWRFLLRMSCLNLRLIPAHPDHCGGLQFLSTSVRGYRLIAFAIGSLVAGGQMGLILKTGETVVAYKTAAIAVVVVVLALAVGPLMVFTRKLRNAKAAGVFKYGSLGADVGMEFERKWLDRESKPDSSVLKVVDFSTMTDLYQVVGNVYDMKDVPFSLKNLNFLVVAALVPFIPVVLMTVPLREILLTLAKLVV